MKGLLLLVALSSCGGGGGFPVDAAPEAPPPKGKFSLVWSVTDANNQPIPCAQIGGNFVTVTLRNRAVQGGETEVFSCASLMATSLLSFAPGIYDFSFELGGVGGQLATAPAVLGVEIKPNETAVVSPATFAVDATGKLDLAINTGVGGGNCGGGANIGNTLLSLKHSGAACEPVTFAISAGASKPAGSYVVDCTTAQAICIDNDQRLTVTTLPSGNYQLQVTGTINANDCWKTTASLTVPPLSKTLMQTLNLTHQTVGC